MKAFTFAVGLLAAAPVSAASPTSDAQTLLAQMKAVCGGAAWDRVNGWHETGVVDAPGGVTIENEVWHDMRSLKTAMVGKVNGKIIRHAGFDGVQYWQIGPDGKAKLGTDPAVASRIRRDTYLSSFGWFFPDRFPAQVELAASQSLDSKQFKVLRITPENADTFDLWVDPETHLVRRIVAGSEYAELSDYRTFDGVCTATRGRQGSGDPTKDVTLSVRAVETNEKIPSATFEPPAD